MVERNVGPSRLDSAVGASLSPPHWRDAHPAFAAALDLTSDAVYFVTPDTLQICGANAAAAARTGYETSELLFLRLPDVVISEDGLEPVFDSDFMPDALPAPMRALERSKSGRDLLVEIHWQLVESDDDSLLVAVVRDQSATEYALAMTAATEERDYLTSLRGRASLTACLRAADERAATDFDQIAVLFLDVDRFKQINDTHGHLVGDRVLQTIAARLLSCVRPDDLVARYGGDEFVVLLQGVRRPGQVEQVVSRIAAEIAIPIPLADGVLTVSASIGQAIGRDAVSAEDLLDEADRAMYQAKRARRAKPR
jgi:diguanylate cyclase (GGDEF)-like protein